MIFSVQKIYQLQIFDGVAFWILQIYDIRHVPICGNKYLISLSIDAAHIRLFI